MPTLIMRLDVGRVTPRDFESDDDVFNPLLQLVTLYVEHDERPMRLVFPLVGLVSDASWAEIAAGVRAEFVTDDPNVESPPLVVVGVGLRGGPDDVGLLVQLVLYETPASRHEHYDLEISGGARTRPSYRLTGPLVCVAAMGTAFGWSLVGDYALTDQYHVHHELQRG